MSKNNWTKTVATINREKYTIPDGWDTRDKVAADLQCAPDRVADLLKPGIQSGQIERQDFPVWDDARRLTVRVTCYRVAGPDKVAQSATKPSADARIRAAIERYPHKTDREIAKNLSGVTSQEVAAIRAL
jgi:hypothetical protein